MCCYDVAAAESWKHGQDHWLKKCCNNPTGSPVLRPSRPLSDTQRRKVREERRGDCCTHYYTLYRTVFSAVEFKRGISVRNVEWEI